MGSEVRLLIGEPLLPQCAPPLEAADRERAFVWEFGRRLSRFPRRQRPVASQSRVAGVGPRVATAASRGRRRPMGGAAQRRPGRPDAGRRARAQRVRPFARRSASPPRSPRPSHTRRRGAPAGPDPAARWRRVIVDEEAGTDHPSAGGDDRHGRNRQGPVRRCCGVSAGWLPRFVVDCGGDIAVGGVGAQLDPYEIEVEHPLTGESIGSIKVDRGGIATSGLNVRIWRRTDGRYAHHLLDPSSGTPVWSGLIGATAAWRQRARGRDAVEDGAVARDPKGARRACRTRGGDRARQRRGRDHRVRGRADRTRGCTSRCALMRGPSAPIPMVAGQRRLGDRRARADLAIGLARAGDGGAGAAAAGPQARGDAPARAHRAGWRLRDRRARPGSARRPLAEARLAWDHRSRLHSVTGPASPASGSSPAISRSCSAQASICAGGSASGAGASSIGRRCSCGCCRPSTHSAPGQTPRGPGCAPSCSSRWRRSCICSLCAPSVRGGPAHAKARCRPTPAPRPRAAIAPPGGGLRPVEVLASVSARAAGSRGARCGTLHHARARRRR